MDFLRGAFLRMLPSVFVFLVIFSTSGRLVTADTWSAWSEWSDCAVSGVQNRDRTCLVDSAANPGCPGESSMTRDCGPVLDGSWSEWGEWQNCSVLCGVGNRARYRTCTSPAPQFGGAPCDGTSEDWESCDTNITCEAVNGRWSEWGEWQNCSIFCSVGYVTRHRTCTNPAPQYGGAPCNGTSEDWHPCDTNVTCLAVNGGWSDWSEWSACSVTCGGGGQTVRTRSCINPAPEHGGLDCVGDEVETNSCSSSACPPMWSEWSSWTTCWAAECTAEMNAGLKFRSRVCQGGTNEQCPGQFMDRTECTQEC
ncbi:coadhesin-like [Patiria miniata]|uniref:Hemicentin-1 n=1 Tax=Patiria miniata TaxID=46514 RepID=A0A913ZTY0_PATMI|nr:coadhesin-like [Patiria miniata]